VGRRGYIIKYFKRAFASYGKVHAANSAYSIAFEEADACFITPLIYDKNYVPELLKYCSRNNIRALLSLFDVDLYVLSKNIAKFAEVGTEVILAPEEAIRICNDKWATYNCCIRLGLDAPQTFTSLADAISAVRRKRCFYPLIVKPRWGMASLGLFKAENDEELELFFRKSKHEAFHTYLKYESRLTPRNAVIIQECLSGVEHGLDVFNDLEGRYVDTVAKIKHALRAGETDIGETVASEPFQKAARTLSCYLKHHGILSVDCFLIDGAIKVLELNCRISGHYPGSQLAGVNYPKQLLLWLQGKGTNRRLFKYREHLMFTKELVPRIISH
jgi:carbamoyl-phosphate synthase large subunit